MLIKAIAAFEDALGSQGTWGPLQAGRGVGTALQKEPAADLVMLFPWGYYMWVVRG